MTNAAIAFHESLTTPDSEDWTVIPNHKVVHLTAFRETPHNDKPVVRVNYGEAPLADFKKLVEELPVEHDLGCVCVIICRDFEETGAPELLTWLAVQAKAKSFSLTSMYGPATTQGAIAVMKSGVPRWVQHRSSIGPACPALGGRMSSLPLWELDPRSSIP